MATIHLAVTVFVGSLWYADCDPFATIVAESREQAQNILDDLALVSVRILNVDQMSRRAITYDDTILTGGIFAESLDSLQLSDNDLESLKRDGYVWIG